MEAVVRLGQPLVVLHHQGGAELVILLAHRFQLRVGLEVLGEGEGFEAVGWRVSDGHPSKDEAKEKPITHECGIAGQRNVA